MSNEIAVSQHGNDDGGYEKSYNPVKRLLSLHGSEKIGADMGNRHKTEFSIAQSNKTFFIETYGCQMNKADSDSLAQMLRLNGYTESQTPDKADIVVINTCSVRKTAENRIWGRLGFYKEMKRSRSILLILMGCMAQRLGDGAADFKRLRGYGVDMVVGTFFRDKVPFLLEHYDPKADNIFVEKTDLTFPWSAPDAGNPLTAFVTISHGCNNFCSYCIVPYLRGRETSRPSEQIIEDIQRLAEQGVIQVTLLGQNVNSYGLDNNDIKFPQLLKRICHETDIQWIKYESSHPKDFTEELAEVIAAEDKVSNYLHLAVQSGSNHILEKMNRKYRVEDYIAKVQHIKQLVPKLNLTTDVIVGFSGETESDFQDTLTLMRTVEFDDAYMYKYNVRENTVSAKSMDDDVSEEVKLRRLQELIDLQRQISDERRHRRIGDITEVIPVSVSKKSGEADKMNQIHGLTKEELHVVYDATDPNDKSVKKIKFTGVSGSTMLGEIINS